MKLEAGKKYVRRGGNVTATLLKKDQRPTEAMEPGFYEAQ